MARVLQFVDMHEILPRLYLGSIRAAANRSALDEEGVTHVLSVCLSVKDVGHRQRLRIPPSGDEPCTRLVIACEDKPSARLDRHFEACSSFIAEGMREGAVLVHCQAGQSRSAAVVIAYLMREKSWPLESALRFVQQKRPSVHPNIGFMDQLRALQARLGIQDDDAFILAVEEVEEKNEEEAVVVLHVSDDICAESITSEEDTRIIARIVIQETDVSIGDMHVEKSDPFGVDDARLRCERLRSGYQRWRNASDLLGVASLTQKNQFS